MLGYSSDLGDSEVKNVKWKVSCKGRYLDSGTMRAADDRVVLDAILERKLGTFTPIASEHYTICAGDMIASSFGDEFSATLGASKIDDTPVNGSGHLFVPEPVKGLPLPYDGIANKGQLERELEHAASGWNDPASNPLKDFQHAIRRMEEDDGYPNAAVWPTPEMLCDKTASGVHDMNGDHVDPLTGDCYPKCLGCGIVSPTPSRYTRDDDRVDQDRLREALARAHAVAPFPIGADGLIDLGDGDRIHPDTMKEAVKNYSFRKAYGGLKSGGRMDVTKPNPSNGPHYNINVTDEDDEQIRGRLKRFVQDQADTITRSLAQKAIEKMLGDGFGRGIEPSDSKRGSVIRGHLIRDSSGIRDEGCAPADHVLSKRRLQDLSADLWYCSICNQRWACSDVEVISRIVPIDDAYVRRMLR